MFLKLLDELQELAAVNVVRFVDGPLQQATQVEREPAEGEDHHQAEDRFGYFSSLRGESKQKNRVTLLLPSGQSN